VRENVPFHPGKGQEFWGHHRCTEHRFNNSRYAIPVAIAAAVATAIVAAIAVYLSAKVFRCRRTA